MNLPYNLEQPASYSAKQLAPGEKSVGGKMGGAGSE